MKTYKVETDYGLINGILGHDTYAANDSLAVFITDAEDGSPFATITVCIPEEELSGDNCAFIDTNNCPWAEDFLEANGIARPTGRYGFSGFCAYPEYAFNLEALKK